MEVESAQTVESSNFETRFEAAIGSLRASAPEESDEGLPIVKAGNSKIEIGESSVLFDVAGSATEAPQKTRYSLGADGRMYGAPEGEPLNPVSDVEARVVLGTLEVAVGASSSS